MTLHDLTIVICCHKKDFFMARICIASVRYYYPDITIELIKDEGNGAFSTSDLEKYFQVCIVDLGIPVLGESGAKFHYLYQQPKREKILFLDADIAFTGPFLERLLPIVAEHDYVVSIAHSDLSDMEWVKKTYFDMEALQEHYPDYRYPGYFFNAGQLFLTTGAIDENQLNAFFNPSAHPYWRNRELFILRDQSIYNYLLPTLHAAGKLSLGTEQFMLWAAEAGALSITVRDIREKTLQSGVIHWAGFHRVRHVSAMSCGHILALFEDYYYSRVPMGKLKFAGYKAGAVAEYYLKQMYYALKPVLRKRKTQYNLPEKIMLH